MNLKKIINNIDFITKINENYRQGMRLICCFKIYDLVAASRHMILVLKYHSPSFFSTAHCKVDNCKRCNRPNKCAKCEDGYKAVHGKCKRKSSIAHVFVSIRNVVNAPLNILLIVCILGARCFHKFPFPLFKNLTWYLLPMNLILINFFESVGIISNS